MMIGDAMTPLTPFDPEFDVTVFEVPVFDVTPLYLPILCRAKAQNCFATALGRNSQHF